MRGPKVLVRFGVERFAVVVFDTVGGFAVLCRDSWRCPDVGAPRGRLMGWAACEAPTHQVCAPWSVQTNASYGATRHHRRRGHETPRPESLRPGSTDAEVSSVAARIPPAASAGPSDLMMRVRDDAPLPSPNKDQAPATYPDATAAAPRGTLLVRVRGVSAGGTGAAGHGRHRRDPPAVSARAARSEGSGISRQLKVAVAAHIAWVPA